jgi:hypothetical protein
MPSTLRSIATHALPLLASAVAVSTAGAQQLSADVTVPIRIVVQPVLAIRSVSPMPVRTESRDEMGSAAIVTIETNLPYRLTVRLAPTATATDARVFVRSGNGTFQPLDRGSSIAVVDRGTPGQHPHEIACRVESPTSDGCALIYELSAEYHDTLIRSTATCPTACSLRPAAPHLRDAPMVAVTSRGF